MMGKFKVGDRVRFIAPGYNDAQKVGHEATVVGLDGDGDAIVDTDKDGESVGWTDANLEVILRPSGISTPPEILTLRDQFAMAALTGLLAQSVGTGYGSDKFDGAKWAYEMADAMFAERERVK